MGVAESCLTNGAAKIYSIDIGETGDDFQSLSNRFPNQLFAVQADVTQEASISAAVDKIVEEAGALHGMVVNAGRTNHKSALDFTTEEIEALFSVNVSLKKKTLSGSTISLGLLTGWYKLFGAFYTARCAARAFIKLGIKGAIVFTASMASYRPNKVRFTSPSDS